MQRIKYGIACPFLGGWGGVQLLCVRVLVRACVPGTPRLCLGAISVTGGGPTSRWRYCFSLEKPPYDIQGLLLGGFEHLRPTVQPIGHLSEDDEKWLE